MAIASTPLGSLDLFRRRRGPLDDAAMTGGVWAAGLAALPLLDLMSSETDWQEAADGRGSWDQLASLERVEVHQATGMIVAYQILDRRLMLDEDDWHMSGEDQGGAT